MHIIKRISGHLNAITAVLFLLLTSILCFIPILIIGVLKLFPNLRWRTRCTYYVDLITSLWCALNNFYMDNILNVSTDISGLEHLSRKDWYLVIANHQSWLDIVILHRLLNRKIPVLKFFIKDQLKWIPLLGFCWWVMGCPFMKRYSREYIAKNPHKKGQDFLATQKAVERFKRAPSAIMNFVEGTRFSIQKKKEQNSPYTHLLKPKAGGIGFVIGSMGQQINSVLDITIVYPQQKLSLWDFLCKRIKSVKINVRYLPIPAEFASAKMIENVTIQADFKEWLNSKWLEKDQLIASLKY